MRPAPPAPADRPARLRVRRRTLPQIGATTAVALALLAATTAAPAVAADAPSCASASPEASAPSALRPQDQARVTALLAEIARLVTGHRPQAPGTETDSCSTRSPDPSTTSTAAATPASNAGSQADPSGQTMPTGNLQGWKQIFSDDFTTDVPSGGFPGSAYASRWSAYDGFADTSGAGTYSADALSVHDGVLDLHVGNHGDTATSAAPVPLVNGPDGAWGQKYGRYSVRFKADAVPGYSMAWLLWPDDNTWDEGEVDFPEGTLTKTISAFDHCVGNAASNCFATDTGTPASSGWHTATTEWTPTGITYVLDGTQIGTSATSPSTPMHWVLQTETAGGSPPAGADGHVDIDWVTIWARA